MPFKRAQAFVAQKSAWIKKGLARVRAAEERHALLESSEPRLSLAEARKKLIGRLEELAEAKGFTFTRVSIRRQRTLWGSCSARNAISLNIRLARLPPELTDYVIFHELVHTRIKNHGAEFWRALDEFVGDSKMLDRRLREYGALLAVPRGIKEHRGED